MEETALPPRVETAPVLARSAVILVGAGREIEVLPIAFRLVGFDTGPADGGHEELGSGQGIVPHQFGIETPAALPGQLPVVGIRLQGGRVGDAALAVGLTAHDEANKLFDIPSVVRKLHGQPVEQGRIDRRLPLGAQIIKHLGKACSEKLFPETVHKNPRGQRVFPAHDPSGEVEPVGTAVSFHGGLRQHRRHRRHHFGSGFVKEIASWQNADHTGRRQGDGDQAFGQSLLIVLPGFVRRGQVLPEFGKFGNDGFVVSGQLGPLGGVLFVRRGFQNIGDFLGEGEGIHPFGCRLIGRGGNPEPTQRVAPFAVVLPEFQQQRIALGHGEWRRKGDDELLRLIHLGQHRPADFTVRFVTIDGAGGGKSALLKAGDRSRQRKGFCGSSGPFDLDDHLREDKIAIAGPARPLRGQGAVGQGLNAETCDRLAAAVGFQTIDVLVRFAPTGQHRFVRLHREFGFAE